MKRIIVSPHAPKAVGPYSQAIEAGGVLYISGQLPIYAVTGNMPEGVEAQTRQSLTNLRHILEEAGYTLSDVVKTTVLLQNIGDFAAMNRIYAEFFIEKMPARVCYQVGALPMGASVEIDAVAIRMQNA
jgi:2-iminobutanoate/2-iminopropanoate deaminase